MQILMALMLVAKEAQLRILFFVRSINTLIVFMKIRNFGGFKPMTSQSSDICHSYNTTWSSQVAILVVLVSKKAGQL